MRERQPRQNGWFQDHQLQNDCVKLYEDSIIEQSNGNGKLFYKKDFEKLNNLCRWIQYDNVITAHGEQFKVILDNEHNAFRELRGLEKRGYLRFFTRHQDSSLGQGVWRVEINPGYAFMCDVDVMRYRAIEKWYSTINIQRAKIYDIFAKKYL